MEQPEEQKARRRVWSRSQRYTLALGLCAVAFAASAFVLYGLHGHLGRDDAFYLYIGQQIAKGIPPYVRCNDAKAPLASYVIGGAVHVAQLLRLDDILTVRAAFLAAGSLAAGALFLLGRRLFSSRRIGLLASLTLVAFPGYAKHAASGPRPKTLAVLFEILSLWCTAERRWLAAGLCGGLAAWTWQPLVILPLASAVTAMLQTQGSRARLRAVARVVVGFLIPSALLSALLSWQGAWSEFVRQALLSALKRGSESLTGGTSGLTGSISLFQRVLKLLRVLRQGYGPMAAAALLGACAGVWLLVRRMRRAGGPRAFLARDGLAGWAISSLALLALSLWDLQGYVDLYVLLPLVALPLAWLLARGGAALARRVAHRLVTPRRAAALICLLLAGVSIAQYGPRSADGLNRQRAWASEIAAGGDRGEHGWLLALGRPEILALLHQPSDHPYVYPDPDIFDHLERNHAGGFAGWLEQQLATQPSRVVLGPNRSLEAEAATEGVLVQEGYVRGQVGDWTVFRWDPEALSVPVGLQASDGMPPDRVRLSWKPVPRATRYEVYRALNLGGTGERLAETQATTYEDLSAPSCRTLHYWIVACDDERCGVRSAPDVGFAVGDAPNTPTGMHVVPDSEADSLELAWAWPEGAEFFLLYRGLPGEVGGRFAKTRRARYVQEATWEQQAYEYWVVACNVCGCSAPSRRTSVPAVGR